MNNNTRTKNSTINIITNILYQGFILIMTFVTRRVFIEVLGVQLLGISGLFSNILQVLSLAELGISGAISFSMYKELAEGNEKKLQALNSYYKKLYTRIAIFIFVIGIALLPFLHNIINLEKPVVNIELYYIVFLLDTVFSYLFIYKSTIVTADQKQYKLKIVIIIADLIKFTLQIISLILLKNYFVYLIIQVACTLISNIIRSYLAEKWYPFIKEKSELPKEEKKDLWKSIKSMMYYKFGGVILNNTDNILISILVNTEMVGYYSNYMMIYNKINSCINLFFSSIQASLGNLNVTSKLEKKYETYKTLNLINYWFFAFATIGIYFIAEDVILAMSGNATFLLGKEILLISLVSFYIQGNMTVNFIYRETTGLFKLTKYSMLICSILNLILSVVLGKFFGLFGILIATVVSRVLTNMWYEPYLLFKKVFSEKPIKYFLDYLYKTLICIAIILVMTPLISLVTIDHLYIRILVKFIICLIIPNIIFILVYCRTEEFKYIIEKIKEILSGFSTWLKNKKEKSSN